jgi:hypothetical protein
MAAKTVKQIEIPPLETAEVEVKIVGRTPLITHAWSEKAKRQMLESQQKKAKKAKHDVRVPMNDFIDSMYWLTEKPKNDAENDEEAESYFHDAFMSGAKFGFRVDGIKKSIVMGAKRSGLDVVMTELKASFFLKGATDASTFELAEIIADNVLMREDMVRVGGMSKTADLRYRAMFENWEIPLLLEYNVNGKYSIDQICHCIQMGGFACGIGEWRPERDGQMGMYRLELV